MPELTTAEAVVDLLRRARTVAVLGASTNRQRPGFYVPDYLHRSGYRVIGVNPTHAGDDQWGSKVLARLDELNGAVDVVDVFRRPEHLPGHLDELLAMDPLPGAVWFQQGIRHDRVAAALVAAGIDVVQDRCMLADHRRFLR